MYSYNPQYQLTDADENAIRNAPIEKDITILTVRELELCIEHLVRNISFYIENMDRYAIHSLVEDSKLLKKCYRLHESRTTQ